MKADKELQEILLLTDPAERFRKGKEWFSNHIRIIHANYPVDLAHLDMMTDPSGFMRSISRFVVGEIAHATKDYTTVIEHPKGTDGFTRVEGKLYVFVDEEK